MHALTEVALVNAGRAIVYALLALAAGFAFALHPENVWYGLAHLGWVIAAIWNMPGRLVVAKKDDQ